MPALGLKDSEDEVLMVCTAPWCIQWRNSTKIRYRMLGLHRIALVMFNSSFLIFRNGVPEIHVLDKKQLYHFLIIETAHALAGSTVINGQK